MSRARIDDGEGRSALDTWAATRRSGDAPARPVLATAVRWTLQALADRAPGSSVEVRVPPYGAVQCVEGPGHTRGTPPNVIETDTLTWLLLATGALGWETARDAGRVHASGTRADVAAWLPVVALADHDE